MKNLYLALIALLLLSSCAVQKPEKLIKEADVARLIKTLSSDEMEGRASFTPGIDKAAKFIENEFREIGLQPVEVHMGFRQEFSVKRIKAGQIEAVLNGKSIEAQNLFAVSDLPNFEFNNNAGNAVYRIAASEQFIPRYREIIAKKTQAIVLVDNQHATAFKRFKDNSARGRVVENVNESGAIVFVLGETDANSFNVKASNVIEELPLFNVAGMIPGKTKPQEIVLISAHYDHLGIVKAVDGDAIANGADDDASGTTAVISLARYYKKLNNNERSLVFVAFTAEEIGGYGARYFSSQLNPDDVVAMFNIEMIGKESKFGKNAAFITGYDKSDFGEILQKNLEGTDFKFHPDPYPSQNLFYRSDNATLAALGVPAHTISTDQIDTDKFYHTVNDEFETLDVSNIYSTIKAIALSARSIISGTDTPKRIPKLKQ
jgi:Zn-dependent M28 family amino/carboxypeptidase